MTQAHAQVRAAGRATHLLELALEVVAVPAVVRLRAQALHLAVEPRALHLQPRGPALRCVARLLPPPAGLPLAGRLRLRCRQGCCRLVLVLLLVRMPAGKWGGGCCGSQCGGGERQDWQRHCTSSSAAALMWMKWRAAGQICWAATMQI